METNRAGILHVAFVTVIVLCIFLEWSWAFFPKTSYYGPEASGVIWFCFARSLLCRVDLLWSKLTWILGNWRFGDSRQNGCSAWGYEVIPALLPISAASYAVWSHMINGVLWCTFAYCTSNHNLLKIYFLFKIVTLMHCRSLPEWCLLAFSFVFPAYRECSQNCG